MGHRMVALVTTPASQVSTPHFAKPFRLGTDGAFAVVEQDSLDDVMQCIEVLVSTEIGSREELPGYGITDPTFTTSVDLSEIAQAIDDWEDRASVDINQAVDTRDDLIRNVSLSVGLA